MEIAKKNLKLIEPRTEDGESQKTRSANQTNSDTQIGIAEKNDIYEVSRRTTKEKSREEVKSVSKNQLINKLKHPPDQS
jgi:hypothetical protein